MKNSMIQKDGKASVATIMVFDNPEFGHVRLSLDENGKPLFCGKDVCEVLGYRQPHVAVHQHVNIHDVIKRHVGVPTGKRTDGRAAMRRYQMLFVTESGFYALVLGSKLDTAQKFKHWVTSVVLPQIRKTGGFIPLHEGETDKDIRRRTKDILQATIRERDAKIALQEALLDEKNKRLEEKSKLLDGKCKLINEQETEIDRLLPKALYADNVLDSISCYTTTQIAKELGMTAQELNRLLCAERVQYYQSGQYMLYAEYAHRGLAKSRTHFDLFVGCDTVHTRVYLVWTERGRKFIHQLAEA